jgi:SAM-dependent MidA family methyltransferase
MERWGARPEAYQVSLDLDPGTGNVGNARLVNAIIEEMAGGAISFERFMEMALYHPGFGYYRKPGRVGTGGDYLTSPTIHPMFGWAIAAWCRNAWEALGSPPEFTIFEPGAGEGRLAAAILDWAAGRADGFARALRYIAIEPHAPGADPRVTWARPPVAAAECGVVVTNELFDAFPVRLFEATERGPAEVLVRWDGARFVETRGQVVSIEDAPAEGRFEVNPGAYPAMRSLCGLVKRGAVLVFDYGYPQEELWAPWRTQGTLLCFYRHTAHEDPYVHVGEQDMTTHVNFSELASAAAGEGFAVFGPVSQAEFLLNAGLGAVVESVRGDMAEYFARRRALQTLTDSAGLGRVRVLAASRGMPGPLPGFETGP